MKKYFLFDLDGTIADTGEGITKSVQYALDYYGIYNEPEESLKRFVGPPLHKSFEMFFGFSPSQAMEAVEKYRERYREKGVYESPLYPGMKGLLEELSRKATLCIATSKPEHFANKILELRDVKKYFTVIVGANMDGTRTDKAEVISEVLNRLKNPPLSHVVMIGDREHDIIGASTCGLESVGVKYGFSVEGELERAGAAHVVSEVSELQELCLRMCKQ